MGRWLCVCRRLALGVYEFRIEVHSTVPLNRVEGDPDALEMLIVLDLLKHSEIEIRLHVESTVLAIVELDSKSESETIFKVSDATHGQVSEESVAGAESGWRMLFLELKKYVEGS